MTEAAGSPLYQILPRGEPEEEEGPACKCAEREFVVKVGPMNRLTR